MDQHNLVSECDNFNDRLIALRESLRMRPSDICRISGINPSVYALYERGVRSPSLEPLRLLMRNQAFRDKCAWLILGKDQETDPSFSRKFFSFAYQQDSLDFPGLMQGWIRFNEYTVSEASKVIGISENTLSGVIYGYRASPQFKTVKKIMTNSELLAITIFYMTGQILEPMDGFLSSLELESSVVV